MINAAADAIAKKYGTVIRTVDGSGTGTDAISAAQAKRMAAELNAAGIAATFSRGPGLSCYVDLLEVQS